MGDVKCQMQQGNLVSEQWCDLAQYHDVCCGCKRNRGDMESRYQRQKREALGLSRETMLNLEQKEADDKSYQ